MRKCRVMPQFPFGLRTEPGFPAPPPPPLEPIIARAPSPRPAPSEPPPPIPRSKRSRSWRLLHDCLCLPDYHVMKAFYDARRRVEEIETRERMWTESPVAIGLLLTFLPPLGVTLLWASHRLSRTAKIGVTAYAATITVAALLVVTLAGR
jgi:hypothetical protein